MIWYQCKDCIFGTNSRKEANKHQEQEGHAISEEKEEG
jgi:hypothetical protein